MDDSRAVVVAVDGSQGSSRAVEWAVAEARIRRLPVVLVHCVPRLLLEDEAPPAREEREQVDQVLRERRGSAPRMHRQVETTIRRVEPLGIDVGRCDCRGSRTGGLLVVGARGHSRLGGLLLGSVSQYAVRHAAGPSSSCDALATGRRPGRWWVSTSPPVRTWPWTGL